MSNEYEQDLALAKAFAQALTKIEEQAEEKSRLQIDFMNYPDCILAISGNWPEIVGEGKSKEDAVDKWREAYRLYYEVEPPQVTYII